jgi:mannose-6-phosphate isomerase
VPIAALGGATAAPLGNPVRSYAWGSYTAIPALLGVPPTGEPQAELWMGAHPAAPSQLRRGGRDLSLLACIEAAPDSELGTEVVEQFGARLPFLLKVIAAAAPLSLQAHPNAEQALGGYAEENARGIPLDSPERNYRDPSHKPELLCALSPFDALCGFRSVPDTVRLLDGLTGASAAGGPRLATRAAKALGPYVEALRMRANGDGVREAVTGLLTLPAGRREQLVEDVAAACRAGAEQDGEFAAELRAAADLSEAYPGDAGVVLALLLNLVRLHPGEAIFLPPGSLHAYLRGTGIEIMANSDNVLRGGLTRKHVDIAELLRILDVHDGPVASPALRRVGPAEERYETPVPEFRLSRVTVTAGQPVQLDRSGPQILLVTEGTATVSGAGEPVQLPGGRSAWVPAGRAVTRAGTATVFRATTNLH